MSDTTTPNEGRTTLADTLRTLSTDCHDLAERSAEPDATPLHAEWEQISTAARNAHRAFAIEIDHLDQLMASVYGADAPRQAPALATTDREDQAKLLQRAKDAAGEMRAASGKVANPATSDFVRLERALERSFSVARRLPAVLKSLGERAEDWRDQRSVAARRLRFGLASIAVGLGMLWLLGWGQRSANRYDIERHVFLADSAMTGARGALERVRTALTSIKGVKRPDTLRAVRYRVHTGLESARAQIKTGMDALDRAQVLSHSSTEGFATRLAVRVSEAAGLVAGAEMAARDFGTAVSSGEKGNWPSAATEYGDVLDTIVGLTLGATSVPLSAPRFLADAFLGRSPGAFLVKAGYALAYILIAGGILMTIGRLFAGPMQMEDSLRTLLSSTASSGVSRAVWPLLIPAGLLAGAIAVTPQLDAHAEQPTRSHVSVAATDTSLRAMLEAMKDSISDMRGVVNGISDRAH